MNWILLIVAGAFEMVWATTMKLSRGFTVPLYTVVTLGSMVVSFALLAKATRNIPLSVAYPVWTGIGAVGTVIVGVVLFHENLQLPTLLFCGLLIISIIGIKVTS